MTVLQLPKQWLKSHSFQVECVFLVIEMLAVHFAQWSYHISFPDLATIPLIRLRKFHELTNVESLKRAVKRLIDQVCLHTLITVISTFAIYSILGSQIMLQKIHTKHTELENYYITLSH